MDLSNNRNYPLTQENRARLYQLLRDFDDDQLRFVLTNYLQNSSVTNKYQHYSHSQLLQQCLIIIDNYYTPELEQTLHTLTQNRTASDLYHHFQQQQQQPYYYNQQTIEYNPSPNYRFSSTPAISQQLRTIRPHTTSSQSTNIHSPRPPPQQQQQSSYNTSLLSFPEQIRHSSPPSGVLPHSSSRPVVQRYQVPLLPPSSSNPVSSSSSNPALSSSSSSSSSPPPAAHRSLIAPSTNPPQRVPIGKIVHKTLPFYRSITCVYERHDIFRYDTYRKQYISHDEFILSLDVCNQLALSYDYDPKHDIHKTTKCLLARLVRIDQPATFNGKYEDNLPVNLVIHVNGHILTNLPVPKPASRQQKDLIRNGREIDITSYCMFNPILKNEITITWSYRQDNTNLFIQYANAEYALHIFLVDHLTINELCEQIIKKTKKFYLEHLVKLLARARAKDHDLGLEVSDQKLKLTCPIDQKRLKKPIRATTCQHLQCFDLTNYIALNEKSNKWICPVCNKPALFDDLQIDSYTTSILNTIHNESITEITIDGDLHWKPVLPLNTINESIDCKSNIKLLASSVDVILIDDDD